MRATAADCRISIYHTKSVPPAHLHVPPMAGICNVRFISASMPDGVQFLLQMRQMQQMAANMDPAQMAQMQQMAAGMDPAQMRQMQQQVGI